MTTKTSKKTAAKKTATKSTKPAAAKKSTTKKVAAPKAAPVKKTVEPKERDARLPAVGTVINKTDRDGNVRCTCTVTKDGVEFNGKTYRSLSGAASAAAEHLGLGSTAQNGFVFWGIQKPTRPVADPVEALKTAIERFASRAKVLVEGATGEALADAVKVLAHAAKETMRLADDAEERLTKKVAG